MAIKGIVDMESCTIDITLSLQVHLQYNHYPAVDLIWMDACQSAISAYLADCPDEPCPLPDGIRYQGQPECPAYILIDTFHLFDLVEIAEAAAADLAGSDPGVEANP